MTPENPFRSFVDVLAFQSDRQPELNLFNFLGAGNSVAESMTSAELFARSSSIATQLNSKAEPGDRVLLLFPPGLEFVRAFFGCLCGRFIAVPAFPPDVNRLEATLPRLLNIIERSNPSVILAERELFDELRPVRENTPLLREAKWLIPDKFGVTASPLPLPGAESTDIAYLQFTSGSTDAPKGVMLSHRNLLHNSEVIRTNFEHSKDSCGVIWLPPYHDMGLIGGILQPVYSGFPVYLMSYVDFLKHPLRWLRAITQYGATTSGGPNFAYELLCSRRVSETDLNAFDLSTWDLAFTGAETIDPGTLRAFALKFSRCGFRAASFFPCYGLAESTLMATGGKKSALPKTSDAIRRKDDAAGSGDADSRGFDLGRPTVGCGNVCGGTRLAIVEPNRLTRCDEGEVGEIWLSGPSNAEGYWMRPDLTREVFDAHIGNGDSTSYLRTGDLGFVADGELFITGRMKDVIIVRGANHYPAEIEASVEQIAPEIFRPNRCAAFGIETKNGTLLILAREMRGKRLCNDRSDSKLSSEEAGAAFARIRAMVVKEHQLSVSAIVWTPPGSIPRTENGKIQRYRCRAMFESRELPIVDQWIDPRAKEALGV